MSSARQRLSWLESLHVLAIVGKVGTSTTRIIPSNAGSDEIYRIHTVIVTVAVSSESSPEQSSQGDM